MTGPVENLGGIQQGIDVPGPVQHIGVPQVESGGGQFIGMQASLDRQGPVDRRALPVVLPEASIQPTDIPVFTPVSLPEQPEAPVLRPREAIQADIDAIDRELNLLGETLGPVIDKVNALPPQQQKTFRRLVTEEISPDVAISQVPEEYRSVVQDAFLGYSQLSSVESRQDTLREEMLPYMLEDLGEGLADLTGRLNYDAFFDYSNDGYSRDIEGRWGNIRRTGRGFYFLGKLEQKLAEGRQGSPIEAYYAESAMFHLEQYKSEWEEHGLLFPPGVVPPADELPDPESLTRERLAAVERARDALETMRDNRSLAHRYKGFDMKDIPAPDVLLADIAGILSYDTQKSFFNVDDSEIYGLDPRFVQTAIKHIDKIIAAKRAAGIISKTPTELEADQRRIAEIDLNAAADNIIFEGFEPPEGMACAITPDEIRDIIRREFPPDFINRLSHVEHRSEEGLVHDDNPNIETQGKFEAVWGEGEDSHTVVSTKIGLYKQLFVPEDAPQYEKDEVKFGIEKTLWHEFGHNAHHLLDYDEMREWDEITETDTTALSWYIGHAREDSVTRGKREDFADTLSMVKLNPALVAEFSEPRYRYMVNYITKHLHPDQRQAFADSQAALLANTRAEWKERGYTRDFLKRLYKITEPGDVAATGSETNTPYVPRGMQSGERVNNHDKGEQVEIWVAAQARPKRKPEDFALAA